MELYKRIITAVVMVVLAAALASSYLLPDREIMTQVNEVLPEAETFTQVAANPPVFRGISNEGHAEETVGYVVLGEGSGYGGPVRVMTAVNAEGEILRVKVADHKDTPVFMQMVLTGDFLNQFRNKKVSDPLFLGDDLDAVSGATLSSAGIARGVAAGSHYLARNVFQMEPPTTSREILFGFREGVILLLLALMLVGVICRIHKLRWVTLGLSLVFIGFQFNLAVSINNIAGILMGYFPSFHEHVFWYLWFFSIPVLIFILAKNVFCYWLCPFAAVQEITAKIGGGSFKCSRKIEKQAGYIRFILTAAVLFLAFVTRKPGIAGYEPFAAFFSFTATGIHWFILPMVLFTSFFIYRFWCRFFCPVGVANETIWKVRRELDSLLGRVLHWEKRKSVSGK